MIAGGGCAVPVTAKYEPLEKAQGAAVDQRDRLMAAEQDDGTPAQAAMAGS
jgi:hypothetical protein